MEKKFEPSEYNQKIRLYINKQMSTDERISFENEMISNQSLANEVKAQQFQLAFNYLRIKAEVNEVRGGNVFISKKDEDEVKQHPIFVIFRNNYFRAAAAILLVGFLGYFLLTSPKPPEVAKIPTILPTNTKDLINSDIASSKQPRTNAPNELREEIVEYERAEDITALNDVSKKLSTPKRIAIKPDPKVYGSTKNNNKVEYVKDTPKVAAYRAFYQGLTYLSLNQYDEAIVKFDLVKLEELNEDVEWYKALTYLKSAKIKEGYNLLEKIIQSSSKHHDAAKEIMDSFETEKK